MEIVIDDENTAAYDYYVPRLILQPIVENAIIHGLEEKIEGAASSYRSRYCGRHDNYSFR